MNTHLLGNNMRFVKGLCSRLLLAWGLRPVLSKTCPVRTRHSSFRHLLAAAGSFGLLTLGGNAAGAEGDYVFAEGNAAQLAGVKRVIITNFAVAFQLDGSVRKDDAEVAPVVRTEELIS